MAQAAERAGAKDAGKGSGDGCLLRFRRDARWYGSLRDLKILVDWVPRAAIGSGESVTVAVAPGEHAVAVQMDWCRTAPVFFNCLPSTTVQFVCNPRSIFVATAATFLVPTEVFTVRRIPAGVPTP